MQITISEIWQLIAGLGLFLYGMFHLEDALKGLEGRSFKLFLKKHTQTKIQAILSGTLITGLLQSSSIVNLMVLSFVGAGMLSMRNALGVALGANVGGTFNSWLVAWLGFKVDISAATMPIIAIAGITLAIANKKSPWYQTAKFFMGFGLIFLGLDMMKSTMEFIIQTFDFTPYLHYPLIVFVLLGFIITALIQTSAATVVLVLSALYAHILPIETAVAVVLGAELGTTIKILIGSIGGIASKKRVAFGNILFNITTSCIGFIFLSPIIELLMNTFGIKDPIFILVAFQTFINLLGIVLFYFFLDAFGDFLEKRFVSKELEVTYYLQNAGSELIDADIEILELEVKLFLYRVIHLNMQAFHLKPNPVLESRFEAFHKNSLFENAIHFAEQYPLIKRIAGAIFLFDVRFSEQTLKQETRSKLLQLISSARNAMHAAKGIKDIMDNKTALSNSINEAKFENYLQFQLRQEKFYQELNLIFLHKANKGAYDALQQLLALAEKQYQEEISEAYSNTSMSIQAFDIATLFNMNRELYSSNKAMVLALKDFLLDKDQADHFENSN